METEIQNFYKDKSVFLTGGTGFLGKVFIEKILRVTEVKCIYVLVRPKRGKDIAERIREIFKDPLFEKLLAVKPDPAKYITPISGDCILPNLGISLDDRMTLLENVDVVVHSAATVRFNEPLSTAIAINLRATIDLILLARKMSKLQAFVHVSSAFANCIEQKIEERYYVDKLGITAEKICRLAMLGSDVINTMSTQLCKNFPNTYCFTKALAEEAVLSMGKDLPICIFRPGIVIPTYEDPIPGWIDNFYGPTSILYGTAFGVLRVMFLRPDANAAIVPVDFCANMMLTCAWNTAKSAKFIDLDKPLAPPIYNLVPFKENALKWNEYKTAVEKHGYKIPLSRMIWFPFLITTESKLFYKLFWLYYHTIPGYVFDFFLMLMGKKRRLVKTYRKIHKQMALLEYFVIRDWTFETGNTRALWKSMSTEDQQLFSFNMQSIDWEKYFYNSLYGMRRFLAREGPETIPKALKKMNRLILLHRAVQVVVYGSTLLLLLWTFTRLFSL